MFQKVLEQLPPRKIETLTFTRGQFFPGAIAWLPPNPKTDPNLDQNPKPNR